MPEEQPKVVDIQKPVEIKPTFGEKFIEFLMVYGWAILVVLVAIGALFYFGVF